jgi:hypothetical protein
VTRFPDASVFFLPTPATLPTVAICQQIFFTNQFSQVFPVRAAHEKKPYQRGENVRAFSACPYQRGGREFPQSTVGERDSYFGDTPTPAQFS